MKIKSLLIILIITISSVYANAPKVKYHPNYDEEPQILELCKSLARSLEYDDSKIDEFHFVTLPQDIIAKYVVIKGKNVILVNRTYQFRDGWDFRETLVHEICHIYTDSNLEWHIAMVRAASKCWGIDVDILEDEKTHHLD